MLFPFGMGAMAGNQRRLSRCNGPCVNGSLSFPSTGPLSAGHVRKPMKNTQASGAGTKPRRKENRRISSVARAAIGAARAEKLGAVAERSMAADSKSDRGDDVVPEKPSPSRVQTPPAPPFSRDCYGGSHEKEPETGANVHALDTAANGGRAGNHAGILPEDRSRNANRGFSHLGRFGEHYRNPSTDTPRDCRYSSRPSR